MIGEDCDALMEIWHHFAKVYVLGKRRMEDSLQITQLKPIEVRILYYLSEENFNVNRLAEMNFVTPAWITGVLDDLENRGYIVRSRNASDRRVVNVEITDKGREILAESHRIYVNFLRESLSSFTDGEIEEFTRLLRKIEETLNRNIQEEAGSL
ncbi:cytolysin slyA related protein [Thermoplasma acidophilum]|uniref:Cytolysin slyA related protein n=1 Tax=Thermoplasma acidophilum (strain ATCC 25905 / DSM 1728 / JCM 9062 / NBRC 15155 / AMRC-C165) TaxID=273075 RepID=Q9HL29_THEAC|nr:MarR family winged helix-turn-helix transcriptional regulator [Thermoplasma acidophilum]MCY0851286.1 MarR family winged helix-turn-helix transcriptional regulator [Thermoplasma acidophilum]CAC11553.1 cytolysin slyA related protein [Thermoplasma acidophilum]